MLAGPPTTPVEPPRALEPLFGSHPWRAVWLNGGGGLTFVVDDPAGAWYVKWSPTESGVDLDVEKERLDWVRAYTPVPEVLGAGRDSEGTWLMTASLQADNATSEKWKKNPGVAASSMGRGLRSFHDTVPVALCPFSWSVEQRLLQARTRGAPEFVVTEATHDELNLGDHWWDHVPDVDLVVCHGDACAPNTLLGPTGEWRGHVDLGQMGVADRWADLAVAAWSTEWNFGPGWEFAVYDGYGTEPDHDKISFYRKLWQLE